MPGGSTLVPLGEVGLVKLPERLAQLGRAVVISGTVIGETSDGALRVRTQAGEVVFRTEMALAADTPVTLQIPAGQPPAKANAFVAVSSGGAGGPHSSAPLVGAGESPPVTTTLGPAAKVALAGGLPGSPSLGPALASPSTGLADGAVVPGRVLPPVGHEREASALPTPGTTVAVRVLGQVSSLSSLPVAAPGSASPSVVGAEREGQRPAPPLLLTGTITGTTAAGQPILTTPQGALALTIRGAVPPGLQLAIEIADPRQMFASSPANAVASTRPAAWPALSETLTTLAGVEGALAHSLLVATLPQPNKRLATALSFFLDRARRGDARGWLGEEAAEALEGAGRKDLLKQLGDEFRAVARQAAETPPGEWRPFPVPLFDGTALQRVELFIRAVHGDEDEDNEEKKAGRRGERSYRFLVDLEMSRLGALQLDGLVKVRRFDLILRSVTPLSEALRHDLLGAFTTSLEAVGFAGGLGFQVGTRGWVKPVPGASGGHGRHGVIA